jgi:hypothetical protein
MGLNERHLPNVLHAPAPGAEALPNHENDRRPDELTNWESVWIDLGGEG